LNRFRLVKGPVYRHASLKSNSQNKLTHRDELTYARAHGSLDGMPEDCASLRGSKPVKLAFGGAILATIILVQVRNCSAEPVTTNDMRELTDAPFEENSYSWTSWRLICADGGRGGRACASP